MHIRGTTKTTDEKKNMSARHSNYLCEESQLGAFGIHSGPPTVGRTLINSQFYNLPLLLVLVLVFIFRIKVQFTI